MNKYFTLVVLLAFLLSSNFANCQNYMAAAAKNEMGLVELYIRDYCYSEIQWQFKEYGSSTWNSIQGAVTSPYLLDPNSIDLDNNIFRAVVQILGDTTQQVSYDFGISLIEEYEELEIGSLYNGTFIYYNNLDTLLATYFTRDERAFGCVDIDLPDTLSQASIGQGYTNSVNVMDICPDANNAVQFCDELILNDFDDWFLPSIDELVLALQVLGDNKVQQLQNQEFGDFLNNPKVNFSPICVSSTQHSLRAVFASRLSNGTALDS